jgi:hypothetical protein
MQDSYKLLQKYQNMIRSAAWGAAKAWGLDFDDVESQGYLVFMEALERYEEGRASFSTFLFNRLKTLNDYCEREVRLKGKSIPILEEAPDSLSYVDDWSMKPRTDACAELSDFTDFCDSLTYLETKASLSMDAKDLLQFILMGDWGKPGSDIKPSLFSVQKAYKDRGWKPSRTTQAWNELKDWYITSHAA